MLPYTHFKFDFVNKKWINDGRGVEAQLLYTLGQYFNFTFDLINLNYNFGRPLYGENNEISWTGLTGLIANEVNSFF